VRFAIGASHFGRHPDQFFYYGYPLLQSPAIFRGVRIASLLDIALMKITAISQRGRKRDFVDLYFIAQDIPLTELLDQSLQKFPNVRDFPLQAARALVYFADAEQDKMPRMFQQVQWSRVKKYFEREVARISKGWVEI